MRSQKRRMKRPITAAKFRVMHADYCNNFLTVQSFAEHYSVTNSTAHRIIDIARFYSK